MPFADFDIGIGGIPPPITSMLVAEKVTFEGFDGTSVVEDTTTPSYMNSSLYSYPETISVR